MLTTNGSVTPATRHLLEGLTPEGPIRKDLRYALPCSEKTSHFCCASPCRMATTRPDLAFLVLPLESRERSGIQQLGHLVRRRDSVLLEQERDRFGQSILKRDAPAA